MQIIYGAVKEQINIFTENNNKFIEESIDGSHANTIFHGKEWNAWKVLPGPKSIPIILISPHQSEHDEF